ncbi:iron hydrogenase [Dipodascopsis uninucleata]
MSAILSANDLNDFISPGLACINPVVVERSERDGPTEIQIDSNGNPIEVSLDGDATMSSTQLNPAQINLSDCLACSGCITSAESVLVAMQSHTELLTVLKHSKCSDRTCGDGNCENEADKDVPKKKVFVASISHQSRASLAAAFNLSIEAVDARLITLFRDILGFKYLVGMGVGRQVSVAFSVEESENRTSSSGKPILASACPGWICYVEKTHPHVIPYLSNVKSPQQITGSLLKALISQECNIKAEDIYHVSVMPCFDKKLEASRPEFKTDGVPDVDCVITTKEVCQLLLDENIDFVSGVSEDLDPKKSLELMKPAQWPSQWNWESSKGSSSGGYLWHILAHKAAASGKNTKIVPIPGKNADMVEFHVVDTNNEKDIIAKAAQIYGFRNIQNLVRKLKSGPGGATVRRTAVSSKSKRSSATSGTITVLNPMEYDYVEVMACPGGCINGGGQIGPPNGDGLKEWKVKVEEKYREISLTTINYDIVSQWVNSVWSKSMQSLLLSEYQVIEKLEEKTNIPAVLVGDRW